VNKFNHRTKNKIRQKNPNKIQMEGVELNKFQRIPTSSKGTTQFRDTDSIYDSEDTTIAGSSHGSM
jgi:hypothetical protein